MKTYRILSAILTQILFAIITVILVYGIFEKDWIITMLSFAARSCLHWISIENQLLHSNSVLRRSSHKFFQ